MKRTCSLCGAVYEATDTITRCTEIQSGTYCGGEVLPRPAEEPKPAKCLVCMDKRVIYILDPKTKLPTAQMCPRLVISGAHGETP